MHSTNLALADAMHSFASSPLPEHERVFSSFYERNEWGADKNPGSSLDATREYRAFIEQFIVEHDIRSVLDAGCGEWGFASAIDWKGARYVGLDIASSVVARNRERYPHVEFVQGDARDLTAHDVFDLLLVKDVLQHWSHESIRAFLTQPALASFCHVLFTNCDDGAEKNADIADGDWRPLNLLSPEFPQLGARAVRRIGTKRILHLGPRLEMREIFERFEWWIINLDRRSDRLAHAHTELARLGVHHARKFQAFDGYRLNLTSQCPDWVRKGAVGCYLSHLALLKQAQARRQPCVIIEDDLVLVEDFVAEFEAFVREVPEDWDVLLLSGGEHCRPPQVLGTHHAHLTATWGTALTILRLSAIDRLLEEADHLDRPIDDFYIRMMSVLKFYSPARKIVSQAWGLGTNIGDHG